MLTAIALSALLLFALLMVRAAYTDLVAYRISNILNTAALILFVPFALASPFTQNLYHTLGIAAVLFAVGFLFFLKGWMAGGDVKMITAVSLWAGPAYIFDFLIISSLAGAFLALMMVGASRFGLALVFDKIGLNRVPELLMNVKLPYGPAIAAGGLVVAWNQAQLLI